MRQFEFPARLQEVATLTTSVDKALREVGASTTLSHKITLLAEELFANSCNHGRMPEGDVVQIVIERDENELVFTYCDTGTPFDTVAAAQKAEATPDEGRVGGIGLVLLREMPDNAIYTHQDGQNRTRLSFCQ